MITSNEIASKGDLSMEVRPRKGSDRDDGRESFITEAAWSRRGRVTQEVAKEEGTRFTESLGIL